MNRHPSSLVSEEAADVNLYYRGPADWKRMPDILSLCFGYKNVYLCNAFQSLTIIIIASKLWDIDYFDS